MGVVEEAANRDHVEQMGLAHTRQKFIRISHFIPPSCSTPSFHSRRRGQSLEAFLSLSARTRLKLNWQAQSWNLYPSRNFQNGFSGSVFVCRDDRASLPRFSHVAGALLCAQVHNRFCDIGQNNNDDLDSIACTSRTKNRIVCMKECIPGSGSCENYFKQIGEKNCWLE